MKPTTREIKLEPDYKALFRTMIQEVQNQGQPRSMLGEILPPRQELEALQAVQRFIAPLAICINSATTIPEIEKLRTVLADLSSEWCRWISELDAQMSLFPEEEEPSRIDMRERKLSRWREPDMKGLL